MRIVTRPDFDGVVCAVILFEALDITRPVKWVQPSEVQRGLIEIYDQDIIANLPYVQNCKLWFDHHVSNQIDKKIEGAFKIAPSAAGIIYQYYKNSLNRDYSELIEQTDKIDSADLTPDEIIHPENHPYVLLSMTVSGHRMTDESYWNHLTALLREKSLNGVFEDPQVDKRCKEVVKQNKNYKKFLLENSYLKNHVSISDFRMLDPVPDGNRFLVYSLFPECVVNVKVYYDKDKTVLKIGHSIVNRHCNINIGKLLSLYGGGGHQGAGACRFDQLKTETYIGEILEILFENKKDIY